MQTPGLVVDIEFEILNILPPIHQRKVRIMSNHQFQIIIEAFGMLARRI